MALSERRAQILALIVDDYIVSAQPVGSQALVQRHNLPLSSATVRNEMQALENEGLITHPHTSAGRIPSHRGYRYYVGSLMREKPISPAERARILHQFHQAARRVEEWTSLAASVLARALHNAALVTEPRLREVFFKNMQLVELGERRALMVVVTADAAVHQRMVEFDETVDQERLTQLANRLNIELRGRRWNEIPAPAVRPGDSVSVEGVVLAELADLLRGLERESLDDIVVEGVREMLRQPEFEDSDRVLDTLAAVESRELRKAIPIESLRPESVAVVIGDENREGPYREMSFILARYGLEGGVAGIVGVLGPTRMPYADAVAHVRYIRGVLTQLIRTFYGGD